MRQIKMNSMSRRVSASAVAAMLATDGWIPGSERSRHRKKGNGTSSRERRGSAGRTASERERADALPAGHPVSWNALWGGDRVPAFPGLLPIGAHEHGLELN
ncbi:transcriptional regulator [Gluconobacter wancherniae]|uniref:Uncharacterized protein n=1 Tax=Gluconobacter wancherniae NBRC 103581 TaxID=656744 RepID=A0A511B260_9PROT|nr:transcriptional regulator [Gluconobacter wancherniae]MBF0854424.1 transcriptional regulator [Gluconobacter wancherniae]GBD57485.1 hypothetical protein NBRC103581_02073 [Gluconobacter wancherniae NBRC 103581]GEK93743.1 hypothetical protein GWA01_15130 [Gluconobacter wancherniae NBRC 103581]